MSRPAFTSYAEPSEDLKTALATVTGQLDQEHVLSERLDSKARNQVALAGTWFTLAQAVVAVAFQIVMKPGHVWLDLVVAPALAALVCLAVSVYYAYKTWNLQLTEDISAIGIRQMLSDVRQRVPIVEALVETLADVLEQRRAVRRLRGNQFSWSTRWWLAASGFILVELVMALLAIVTS